MLHPLFSDIVDAHTQPEPIVHADLTIMPREEWLAARSKWIGASDAAAALGLDTYRSPLKLWCELTGRIDREQAGEAAKMGLVLEPVVANLFSEATGLTIYPSRYWLGHPTIPYLRATLDYVVKADTDSGPIIPLELKTRSAYAAHEYADGEIPVPHRIQLATQMAVCNSPHGYLATLIGGQEFVWQRVERDLELERTILDGLAKFWHYVETDTQPPVTGADVKTLAKLHPKATATEPLRLSAEALDSITRYRWASSEIKRLEAERDQASAELRAELADHDMGTVGAFRVTWKERERKGYTVEPQTYRHFAISEIKTS